VFIFYILIPYIYLLDNSILLIILLALFILLTKDNNKVMTFTKKNK